MNMVVGKKGKIKKEKIVLDHFSLNNNFAFDQNKTIENRNG